jgi:3-isopropylmalate dehydrogenase
VTRYTVACLAGDGVGPELMAQASRTMNQVAHLHGFGLMELHLPFGGEGFVRYGHRLPPLTRRGYRSADAVLAALPDERALEAVKSDLDVCWSITCVPLRPSGDALVIGALGRDCEQAAVAHAVEIACSRRCSVTSVGDSVGFRSLVDAAAERRPGVAVDHLSLGEALAVAGDDPSELDVVVADTPLYGGFTDALAHLNGSSDRVARGWLPARGAGVFVPARARDGEAAGHGVVNPTSMLRAASLLLSTGLGRGAASRTLERAVSSAGSGRRVTPDVVASGMAATTRDFTDAVIDLLPSSRTDTEHFDEVWG